MQKQQDGNIALHIDQLVLHGFERMDTRAIGAAVQNELTMLLTREGFPAALSRGGGLSALNGGNFKVPAGASATAIGQQIARSLYKGLGKRMPVPMKGPGSSGMGKPVRNNNMNK